MVDLSELLQNQDCKHGLGSADKLSAKEIQEYLNETPFWGVEKEGLVLSRNFEMRNFANAVTFVNAVAQIAQKQKHHPDVHIVNYRKVKLELSTHDAGGLSKNDFIMANKINQEFYEEKFAL